MQALLKISGETKIIGIFGDPVAHSLSPAMHNAAFVHLDIPYAYVPFHVLPNNLPAAVAAVRALHLTGVNVTVPHKEAVIPYLDRLDDSAVNCGAVNTVVNSGGKLTGYNTDVAGFLDALRQDSCLDLQGGKAVVLGAGGAARAVMAALLAAGVAEIILLNRTLARALALGEDSCFGRNGGAASIRVLPLDGELREAIHGARLVVNTVAVSFRRDRQWLADLRPAAGALFFDLRYGKGASDFLALAKELNSPSLDGLGMLLYQGARAFSLFTGCEAPLDVMRQTLLEQCCLRHE